MDLFAPAALFALFIWWFGTGVLLYVEHLPRQTFDRSLAIASALALPAAYGLFVWSQTPTVWGAYASFLCALVVWAWHELTFLTGILTGPRKVPCPPDVTGWRRFRFATATVIHHEVALAATAIVILVLTWGAPNQVGTATFFVLWLMRLSAKLNIFLGVHNLSVEFVPAHLTYLLSYFRNARMNPLMPVSLGVGTIGVVWLTVEALSPVVSGFDAAATGLVASTLALAVLEHAFLVLPVPDAILWRWTHRPSVSS